MKPEVKEELESFDEGRMKDIYTMDQDGKSKEEIAKRLGLKVSTVKSILGEEVLSEFSDTQIDSLKRDYAGLQGKSISGINANKLMKIFDKFDKSKPLLIKLLKAKIPFVSMLAQARLISKHGANAAQLAQMRREQVEQLEEKFQDGFAVRYLDPLNKKRFVVPLKTKKEADDKAAQLKRDGCKDITITKHNLNFKEDSDYLKSKLNDKQISNIKNTWKNKKASDVDQGVKDMIKKMDIPTQLAIKHADIPHLSKLVEKKEVHEGAKKTFARLWSEHKRR
jgi:DNA invertase Pin-like site-specific DNA recombinase